MSLLINILTWFSAVDSCNARGFFGLPTWYSYLVDAGKMTVINGRCDFVPGVLVTDPGSLGLIGLAVLDIALRIAGLVAVGYVVYGGVQLVISQGDSDSYKKARQTVINALIGMMIALIAIGFVSFLGARLA